MPKIKNVFLEGNMDKDSAKALIKNGFTRHVEGLRFYNNDGSDGIGKNPKGSQMISDATGGNSNFKCVGAYFDKNTDRIFYFLANTNSDISKIVEYDISSGDTTTVADDTTGVLKFNVDGYITGINEIDGLLLFSEWGNNPRRVNVERAKGYGQNGFTEDDITVIVKPPINKPSVTLENTDTDSQQENNLIEKFISFAYRWRYLDGEYSALSPFTEFAFEPKTFNYDFAEQSNKSMINKFNQASIDFETGSERVTEIQLVFKESESNAEFIIEDFDKSLLGWGNNETRNFKFSNDKKKRILSEVVFPKYFDNVPRTSKAQSLIEGRLIYGHYKEGYDIVDDSGNRIEIDFNLELKSLSNTVGTGDDEAPSLQPKRTCKSNRDYEVVMVYLDEYGRATTGLSSKKNTVFVENSKSVNENKILVNIDHRAPSWAKYFRFFIKQNKRGYDQILPTLFYEDGVYRWVKLEGADKDKVKEGDFLIVKSDSRGVVSSLVKVKVLEVTDQPSNFLQPESTTDSIEERAGLYFKIKPRNFTLDIGDFENFTLETYDSSRRAYNNPVRSLQPYISKAHFYGDTLDDLVTSGNYTGGNNSKTRYTIKIDGLSTGGNPDTFRWSVDGGSNWIQTDIPIISNQEFLLNNGVRVEFLNTTGHSLFDEWTINARSTFSIEGDEKAYAFFRTVNNHTETLDDFQDEIIEAGARLYFKYDEYNEEEHFFELDKISGDRYDNIEEWFHKENILSDIQAQSSLTISNIHFVRGVLFYDDNATQITQNNSQGTMTMLIKSLGTQNSGGDKRVKVRSESGSIQSDGQTILAFETEPKDVIDDVYFEIGKTYDISDSYHNADENEEFDVSQSVSQSTGTITLDFFNAFSYGNSIESYKIKDEFIAKGLDIGLRTTSTTKEEYREVNRVADVTWSDIYESETNFNGLSSFNLSQANFVVLDKEDGSIQRLHNANKSLMVLQEDALGIMPYNRQVIFDTEGGSVVGISTNVLNRNSYRPYGNGKHGISKNPEGFVQIGSRYYFPDRSRGDILRLANDGITEINQYKLELYSSNEMSANKGMGMVGAFDPKHNEYLLHLPNEGSTIAFKELTKGFPNFYLFEPDFMLGADNDLYAWENGVMYKMNCSDSRNNFFGNQKAMKIIFYANQEFSIEKVAHTASIQSSHAWNVKITSNLTETYIPKECFEKIEDYWFSTIMGNTNDNTKANSKFGLGTFAINDGVIPVNRDYPSLSIGDFVTSKTLLFPPNKVVDITEDGIILETQISTVSSFLMYSKNQGIDGGSIRGDYFEIEMTLDTEDEVELTAFNLEVVQSDLT